MKPGLSGLAVGALVLATAMTVSGNIALAGSEKPGSEPEYVAGFTYPLQLKLDPSRISFSRAKYLPMPPAGKVTVQLRGTAVDAAIPGAFRFYLANKNSGGLFTTVSLKAGETIPKGQELTNGIAFVEPGKWYTLVVAYENPTDHDVNFYVTAPTVDPEAAFPFARALCWCAAVPFSAPAHGAFYRVIKVGVGVNTPPGARAIVDWPVVAINE